MRKLFRWLGAFVEKIFNYFSIFAIRKIINYILVRKHRKHAECVSAFDSLVNIAGPSLIIRTTLHHIKLAVTFGLGRS